MNSTVRSPSMMVEDSLVPIEQKGGGQVEYERREKIYGTACE
jgi:hypothetical protein